ncbi:HAD-IA family hydrolase [Xanthomonas cerealis]|uniref:HAD-IA family hydrolase n=1 Tax=Xanthomonas cerealis TaxID=3390025 RepID=UPI003075C8A8
MLPPHAPLRPGHLRFRRHPGRFLRLVPGHHQRRRRRVRLPPLRTGAAAGNPQPERARADGAQRHPLVASAGGGATHARADGRTDRAHRPVRRGAELLDALARAGVQLALVTSNSRDNVERVLGAELTARFRHIGCGAAVLGKRRKLRAALKACRASAARALCVGDEIRDAHAARQAGIAFVGVAWGYTLPAALQPHTPLPLLEHPADLWDRLGLPSPA